MDRRTLTSGLPTKNRPANDNTSIDNDTSRIDAIAKVTGQAQYSRDKYLDGCLFAAFIRCPYGKARIESIDVDAARAVPGVIEVVNDRDRATYCGQPVGYILATSKPVLRRAMRALDTTWRRSAPDTQILDSASDEPPIDDATARLIDGADLVFDAVYTTPVQTHSPLETHGTVVDHTGDSATVYASTQGTYAAAEGIEQDIGLPRSRYEVVCEYVGGGFGSKLNGAGKEGALAAKLSAKHRKPVSVFVDRDEDHLDTGNRPSSHTHVRMGVKKDGQIVGGKIHTMGAVGVARRGGGVRIPSMRYDLGQIQRTSEDVQINAGAPRAFRAPGCPQGSFAEELMLDEIAAMCGIDPLRLRMQLDRDEHRREMYELGAKMIGWDERAPNGSQRGAIRKGYGMGSASWPRYPARAEIEIIINRDGSVVLNTGTQDIGTGQRTAVAVLAAEELGAPLHAFQVQIGSSRYPVGPGSGGSMTAHNTAPAVIDAARDAKAKFLEMLADQLAGAPDDYDVMMGEIMHDQEPTMTWREACSRMPRDSITGRGEFDRQTNNDLLGDGHSHGAQFVEVSVDTDTGQVRIDRVVAIQACGRCICRKTAESQIIGGVLQGLSYALFEDKILDRTTGAMVNPNLEMYKILGTRDTPQIDPVIWTKGQTGVRSLGEPPTIPTAGATACAVYNAIGVPVRDLPLRPDRVLAAIERGDS